MWKLPKAEWRKYGEIEVKYCEFEEGGGAIHEAGEGDGGFS